jgi:hypothetical protein
MQIELFRWTVYFKYIAFLSSSGLELHLYASEEAIILHKM